MTLPGQRLASKLRAVQERVPAPPERVQRAGLLGLQVGIALMAMVSLHPYFLWEHQKAAYAAATLILMASGACCFPALRITRERMLLTLAMLLFLIYLSLLPKVQGGVTRWFFLIPFVLVLLHLPPHDLQGAFGKFYSLFAVSLLPGMVVWTWLVLGLPLQVEWIFPPSDIVQREPTPYFMAPGVVFLPANAMLLPNGGTIFRLCAVYDEPGTVGTIAALCLAASRFRLSDPRGAISFLAGLMSFSIAFAVLVVVGLVASAAASRRPSLVVFATFGLLAGLVPAIGLDLKVDNPRRSTSLTMKLTPNHPYFKEEKRADFRERVELFEHAQIRQTQALDNRALPSMRRLFAEYASSGPGVLLFGIASNASNVHAGDSSSWLQILINYGLVGFAWLFVLFAAPMVWLWRKRRLDLAAGIFCLLFLMSFYQRPVIWLPAQMLIYFAGLLGRNGALQARPA